MDKLIKLLDEFDHKKTENIEWWKNWCIEHQDWIISKRFGFVEWLIENEKIDYKPYWNYALVGEWKNGSYFQLRADETILMLLAIQDEPIEFLISILK